MRVIPVAVLKLRVALTDLPFRFKFSFAFFQAVWLIPYWLFKSLNTKQQEKVL